MQIRSFAVFHLPKKNSNIEVRMYKGYLEDVENSVRTTLTTYLFNDTIVLDENLFIGKARRIDISCFMTAIVNCCFDEINFSAYQAETSALICFDNINDLSNYKLKM